MKGRFPLPLPCMPKAKLSSDNHIFISHHPPGEAPKDGRAAGMKDALCEGKSSNCRRVSWGTTRVLGEEGIRGGSLWSGIFYTLLI